MIQAQEKIERMKSKKLQMKEKIRELGRESNFESTSNPNPNLEF